MHMTSLKIASLSILTFAVTAGAAIAGDGKNCDHKKEALNKTEAAVLVTPKTTVLSTVQSNTASVSSQKMAYSFEEALTLCRDKGASDLQACVDYKTGVTQGKS